MTGDRKRELRVARTRGASQRALARTLGVSRRRIRQILEETGGDPLHETLLASATDAQLKRRRRALVDRIGADIRRLCMLDEELEARATNRILGLDSGPAHR